MFNDDHHGKDFLHKFQIIFLVLLGIVIIWYGIQAYRYFQGNTKAQKNVSGIFKDYTKYIKK